MLHTLRRILFELLIKSYEIAGEEKIFIKAIMKRKNVTPTYKKVLLKNFFSDRFPSHRYRFFSAGAF
jgi:hypothetical protein